jgi:hypothetical protein
LHACLVAEELAARVDRAVAIEIADEEAVLHADPSRALGEAVRVMIETDTGRHASRLDAIAIEVEHERRAEALGGAHLGVHGRHGMRELDTEQQGSQSFA